MKKRVLGIALALLMIISMLTTFVGCGKRSSFTVAFDTNGGTWVGGGELVQTVSDAEEIEFPVLEKDGYIFIGWDKVIRDIKGDTTVKAIWNPVLFTVTFVVNGGTHISGDLVQAVARGKDLVAPVFEKEGFVLIWDRKLSEVTEACTITGSWVPSEYTITFVNKDGTPFGNVAPITIGYGEKIPDLPEGTSGGKRIFAWKQKGTVQDFVYEGQCWQYIKDLELEPVYHEGFMIRYDYNGGEWRLNPIKVPLSSTQVNAIEREGFIFQGWVETDKDGNELSGQTPISNPVIYSSRKTDVYLKAKWLEETYSITLITPLGVFENGTKETTMEVTYGLPLEHEKSNGEKVEIPKIYDTEAIFVGWKYNDVIITKDTVWDIKDGSVILEAVFRTTYIFTLSLESQVTNSISIKCSLPEGTPLVIKCVEGEQLRLPTAKAIVPEEYNDPKAFVFTYWFYWRNNAMVLVADGTVVNEENFPGFEEKDGIIRIDLVPRVKKSSTK